MTTKKITRATPAVRHAAVTRILATEPVRSQAELLARLEAEGVKVAQATLSRDLETLGAVKLRAADGGPGTYVIPEDGTPLKGVVGGTERLSRLLGDLLTAMEAAGPILVVRTPPGAAQYLGSALDRAALPEIAGCIAGDDTIFVLARPPATTESICALFTALSDDADEPAAPSSTDAPSTAVDQPGVVDYVRVDDAEVSYRIDTGQLG